MKEKAYCYITLNSLYHACKIWIVECFQAWFNNHVVPYLEENNTIETDGTVTRKNENDDEYLSKQIPESELYSKYVLF